MDQEGDDVRVGKAFVRLVELMRTLRGPEGCPWDRQQDAASLRRYVLEEAYEVVSAIEGGRPAELRDELGDLLLQVVFLAQVKAERGEFDIADVIETIHGKLVRRHPHVFGDLEAADAGRVAEIWESLKGREDEEEVGSVLDGIPRSLPALARAEKVGRRASRLGFDWPDADGVVDKVREELAELETVLDGASAEPGAVSGEAIEAEFGDLLFTLANLARHLDVSPEIALRGAISKFERRFRRVEEGVERGQVDAGDTEALERLWRAVKGAEGNSGEGADE